MRVSNENTARDKSNLNEERGILCVSQCNDIGWFWKILFDCLCTLFACFEESYEAGPPASSHGTTLHSISREKFHLSLDWYRIVGSYLWS